MFGSIMTSLANTAVSVYNWFTSVFSAVGSDAWEFVYSIIIIALVTRFILYPFLKGRIVGGASDEVRIQRKNFKGDSFR